MNYLLKIESTKIQRGLSIVMLGRLADPLEVDIRKLFRQLYEDDLSNK